MTRFSRIVALSIAFAAPISAPLVAETDPQPGLQEFFSVNRIGTFIANTAIAALRTQMELEYEYLSTDLMRGSVSVSGVTVRPLLPYDQARQCVITIDRAVLNTDVAKPFEVASEVNINMIGAKATTACLPREAAMGLRAAGIRDIDLDQFKIRAAYIYATGETSSDVTLSINNFASLDFSASGMILPRAGNFGPSEPAFRVMRAVVNLKDQGGWETVSAILPPNFADPATIKAIGTEAVTQWMSDNGLRAVTAIERNFVAGLMDRVEDFVSDPGEITVEANLPETGIVIEPETYSKEPQALVSALALEARTAPLARSQILSNDDLSVLSNPAALPPKRLLELGRALLEGRGVPQTPALVPDLLERLITDPDNVAEASALIATALQDQDVIAAYPYALRAAAGGIDTAVSLMDRLENQMTTMRVLEAQQRNLDGRNAPDSITDMLGDSTDPRKLRSLALAYFTGSGATRSYMWAYYFALLAEAAGDIGATTLKHEIDGRFSARGEDVAKMWTLLSNKLQAQALEDWISSGLADRYLTR